MPNPTARVSIWDGNRVMSRSPRFGSADAIM
jgi:hypothetical protein